MRSAAAGPTGLDRQSGVVSRRLFINLFGLVIPLLFGLDFCRHAGPLWRDEANSVALTTGASLPLVFRRLTEDSFPVLWFVVLRFFQAARLLSSDYSYRVLGLLIALLILPASRQTMSRVQAGLPIISIALIWLNPLLVRTFCSTRAYGLGTVLAVLCIGSVWTMICEPNRRNIVLATVFSVAAAQCLYYNITFVAACCGAGVLIAAGRRAWRAAAASAGTAVTAGLSLLIYLPAIRYQRHWAVLFPTMPDPGDIQRTFVSSAGGDIGLGSLWPHGMLPIWIAAAAIAGLSVVWRLSGWHSRGERAPIAYIVLAGAFSIIGQYAFYAAVDRPMIYWYPATLLAVLAVCLDALAGYCGSSKGRLRTGPGTRTLQTARLALLAVALITLGRPAYRTDAVTVSNVDLAANILNRQAVEGDYVVVNPYYLSPAVSRYYHGGVPWNTLPPISTRAFGGPDFVQSAIQAPFPCGTQRAAMDCALKSGHAVWVVGAQLSPNHIPGFGVSPLMPGIRQSNLLIIQSHLSGQMASYLTGTAAHIQTENPHGSRTIWPIEDLYVTRVWGIRR